MTPPKHLRGVSGLHELDPLPTLPDDAAEAGMSALMLAIGQGPRLDRDPYAVAKAANFDRLLFSKMPVLCHGPRGVLDIGRVTL